MPDMHIWLVVIIFTIVIGLYILYLFFKTKDKRKLIFSISLFISSIAYVGLSFGFIDIYLENISILWYNIYMLSSIPLMIAIFIAVNESLIKVKNFDKIFYLFIIISGLFVALFFYPEKVEFFPTIFRQVLGLEVLVAVVYSFYKTRDIVNMYFFFYIFCSIIAGIGFSQNFSYLSAFAFFISNVFLVLIFFKPSFYTSSDKKGLKSYFSMEEKLKTYEEKYKKLYNSIPDSIALLSQDGTIIDINDSMAKSLGCRREQIIGKNMHDLLPPDVDKERTNIALKALKTGEIQENNDKRGDFYFNNLFVPIETEDKQKNLMVIARNITKERQMEIEKEEKIKDLRNTELATLNIMEDMQETVENLEHARKEILDKNEELKMANQELNVAREQLSDLNATLEKKVEERTDEIIKLINQKDQFIGQLGHDLKTPLTPLNTLLPIVYNKVKDEKIKEILNISIKNVNYMKNLVVKTLKLARLNSPSMQLELEKTNLLEEVNNIIDKKTLEFKKHKIHVENLIDENLIIDVDKLRIEELFDNIIANAIKYSKDDGGKIIIDAKEEKDEVKISIQDQGQGMNKEQAKNIFNEFYKADESRHDFESTGLGLSICKRIIEHHGGKIWAESGGLGKGTTFYLTFKKLK